MPKILIANQTRRIEAVIDRDGAWLPSVPVITCITDRLDDVAGGAALRRGDRVGALPRRRQRAERLGVRLTARLLASIPLPAAMAATPTDAS